MNGSTPTPPNGPTSFALGFLTAASSVLLSQVLVLFSLAADRGGFIHVRFFNPTLYAVLAIFVVALVVYLAIVVPRRRRGQWMEIAVGKTFGWAIVSTLVLLVIPILTASLPEFGGTYFSFALFMMSLIGTVLGLPLTVALTTLSIRLYRKWLYPPAAQPQWV